MSKYHAHKMQVDGIAFDSRKEAARYMELRLMERAGEIQDLTLQPRFLLQEGFVKNGKRWRKVEYIADFMYQKDGKMVVEDVKGMRTEVYKLKRKLFEFRYRDLSLKEV